MASEGLGTLEDPEAIKPLRLRSVAEATASGLGSGGADSSACACVLARVVDFTCMGAESACLVPGSESAAIRITGELLTPADGLSGGIAVAVLGAKLWVDELARSGVLTEGATGEDLGAGAGAACPESWGVLTGCVLDLPSSP